MKKIDVSGKDYALVDDDNYKTLSKLTWYIRKEKDGAKCAQSIFNGRCLLMHRLVMNLRKGNRNSVIHLNGNGLDNRKKNLQVMKHAASRRGIQSNNTSGYKGVRWHGGNQKWMAQIKSTVIGYFDRKEEAALAYNKEAVKMYGLGAFLNPIGKRERPK